VDVIIGAASDVHATATGDEHEFDFPGAVRKINARQHRDLGLFRVRRSDRLAELLFKILPLKLLFELAKCGFDGNTLGEDVYVRLNRHRRHGDAA